MEPNHPTGGLLRPAGFEVRGFWVRFGLFAGSSCRRDRVRWGQICRVEDTGRDTLLALADSAASELGAQQLERDALTSALGCEHVRCH
jgi:hypothetical protein